MLTIVTRAFSNLKERARVWYNQDMKTLNIWPRKSGQTTGTLIYTALKGGALMCPNMRQAMISYRHARKLNLKPQFPKAWKGHIFINFAPTEA